MSGQNVCLRVNAQPEMMLVVRLTTAGVLAQSGLTIETMEDVKMAAEEACACLMRDCGCESLEVCYCVQAGMFELDIHAADCGQMSAVGFSMSEEEAEVARCVLESLMDEVQFFSGANRLRSIVMRKRLPV